MVTQVIRVAVQRKGTAMIAFLVTRGVMVAGKTAMSLRIRTQSTMMGVKKATPM